MKPKVTPQGELETLRARVAALEALCAAVYQFAGEVGAPVRFLDALAAAGRRAPAGTRGGMRTGGI